MHKFIWLMVIGVCRTAMAQSVYHPVESEQAYKQFKSQVMGYTFNGNDLSLNRFVRLSPMHKSNAYTIEVIATKSSPLFKTFYHTPDRFYAINDTSGDWQLVVNPVFHFASGKQGQQTIYRNTRGGEIFGQIGGDKGIGFYTLFTENQERYPDAYMFAKDSMNYVPNEWFYKPFQKKGAVDFFQARAYVTFSAAKHYIKMQFGHDKHKIVNEMIMFDRSDSSLRNQFDLNYLNPVIFYRAVESSMGSKDNSLMAMDAQWTVLHRYQLYGQFVLDEFKLDYIKNQPNWWANKYAYQIGARAFDLARIKHLDVLMEYNRVRPYTFSHGFPQQSFSHFNQALAHPLGSNFAEALAQVKYHYKRWGIQWTASYAKMGRDSFLNGRNFGANILRSYDDQRVNDFSSTMFMGKLTQLSIHDVVLSYQPSQHLSFDFRVNSRQTNGSTTMWYTLGMRINTALRQFNY